jgi:hypothetical protein
LPRVLLKDGLQNTADAIVPVGHAEVTITWLAGELSEIHLAQKLFWGFVRHGHTTAALIVINS